MEHEKKWKQLSAIRSDKEVRTTASKLEPIISIEIRREVVESRKTNRDYTCMNYQNQQPNSHVLLKQKQIVEMMGVESPPYNFSYVLSEYSIELH